MNEFVPHHFEKLKTELLAVSGIKQIIPSDCKRLSAEIYTKTHKQVSETTLKRVFGFAYSQFKPSVFTISAIAEYCGYTGWRNFSEHCGTTDTYLPHHDTSWRNITEQVKKITTFTLQALKNRTGIPYKQTIPRKFIHEQLAIFEKETYTGTIISAPAGYGKTTALCHWVDKRTNQALYNEGDIILFFNCGVLANAAAGHSLNDWLLALLGITNGNGTFDIDLFERGPQNGKFYLIIDGLNDCNFKRNEFYQLFGQLIDIVSVYQKYDWFKVILSMRSSTWVNNRHFLANKMNNWFLGFMTDWQQSINVPLFNAQEIAQLNDQIDPFTAAPVIKDLYLYNLSHPLYFQYYYQLHSTHFSLNQISSTSIYELTAEHIMQKVYKGKFNDDKVVLLRELVSNMDFEYGNYHIDKLKVHDLLKNHQLAYQELLSSGFLRDINNSHTGRYDNHIGFNNNYLLEYAIAEKAIADNNYQYNEALINRINNLVHLNEHKLPVLKWCMYNMLTDNRELDLAWLVKVDLSIAERAGLVLLLTQLLKKQQAMRGAACISEIFKRDDDQLFNYFVAVEFIDRDYEQALMAMLNFDLSPHQTLVIKTYLCLIAIIKLDIPRLEIYLAEIKNATGSGCRHIPVSPVHCLDTIYFYLKFGIIKKEAMTEITKFYFNPTLAHSCANCDSVRNVVSILAIYTLMLCRNPHKTLRYVNALQKIYSQTTPSQNFLLRTWVANAYVSANDDKAVALFDELTEAFQNEKDGYTTFMKLSYYALKVKVSQFKGNDSVLLNELKHVTSQCDKEGHKLVKVNTVAHLLNNYKPVENNNELFVNFYFDFVKTTRNSGCRPESFFVNAS